MAAPTLLAQRSPAAQILLALVVPAAFGALTGVMLGVSEAVYSVLLLLAAVGGVAAGYEQRGGAEGFGRGLAGGMLFGTFILFAHEISGMDAKAHLPDPHVLLPILTTVSGALLGAVGGALRERRERNLNPPERIGPDAA